MLRKSCAALVSIALLALIPSLLHAEGRYFPETGRGAIYQRTLDLQGSVAVMYVALEPGQEDLPLLSQLRLGGGARTVVVYATNGDATPNDLSGEPPQYTAARRKEEAFAAASLIGAQVYFLNLPDPGIIRTPQVLEQVWERDTVSSRLQRAVRSYRPDLIIIGGDLRGPQLRSVRQALLTRFVLESASGLSMQGEDPGAAAPWTVSRIFTEDSAGGWKTSPLVGKIHPVWKKSYRAIGAEAGQCYASLRFAEGLRDGSRNRTYRQIMPSATVRPTSGLDGLPRVGKRLTPLRNLIRRAISGSKPALKLVAATIDSVEYLIGTQGNDLAPDEVRLVAGWKNTLEDLRCALLEVKVEIAPTDSCVTQAQLLDLKILAVRSLADTGHMRIFFPGARERKWGINESAEYTFNFSPPQTYRVLTPVAQEFNTPAAQFGMLRPIPRTRFSFIIYHEDKERAKNFIYRGEILLRFSPRRTFEILTPAIRAQENEPVAYRLVNVSRDPYRGTIGFNDSLALPGRKPVVLVDRDQVIVDTLRYVPSRDSLPEMFGLKVQLSGEPLTPRVQAKRFDVRVDATARVGILTPYTDGIIELALRRLRMPYTVVPISGSSTGLAAFNTIVVDRDAMVQFSGSMNWTSGLGDWVEKGGHLVILPQKGLPSGGPMFHSFRFGSPDATEPMERIKGVAGHPFLLAPNVISEDDWRNWVVSRSVSGAGLTGGEGATPVVSSADTQAAYLVTLNVGKGRLTVVTLDLISQLTNIHPGAHRLLANLLRPAR